MSFPSRITEHFSMAEVEHSEIASRKGIDNTLPTELIHAVVNTAEGMERVRSTLWMRPISVSSWFRCLTLNRALRSLDTGQHPKGEAVDFICPAYGNPVQICKIISAMVKYVNFDQLILEHTWVHISFNSVPGAKQRNQVLSLLESKHYGPGITDKKGNPL